MEEPDLLKMSDVELIHFIKSKIHLLDETQIELLKNFKILEGGNID